MTGLRSGPFRGHEGRALMNEISALGKEDTTRRQWPMDQEVGLTRH